MVRPDPTTNSVIVSGEASIVNRILEDIAKIYVAPYQIQIDALVTEVSEQGRKSLGLDWSWTEEAPASQRVTLVCNNWSALLAIPFGRSTRSLMQLRNVAQRGTQKFVPTQRWWVSENEPASTFVGRTTYHRIVTGT